MKHSMQIMFATLFVLGISSLLVQAQMTPPGNGLKFDGIDDNVDTHFWANSTLLPQYTVECWVKGSSAPRAAEWNGPIYGYYGFAICWDHDQWDYQGAAVIKLRGQYWRPLSFGPLSGGVWYHLAATWDGRYFKAYKNGTLVNTMDCGIGNSIDTDPTNASVKIGSHPGPPNNPAYFFDGWVDEVRVWNTAHTQSQLQSTMNTVVPSPYPADLLLYYNFDKTSGTTVPNLVSTNYTGSFTSAPVWVESYAMVVPGALPATNILKRSFTANWSAPQTGSVEKYYLDVATNSTFTSFVSGYSNKDMGTSVSCAVSGLNPNTPYYYRVRAYKSSAGYGGYSAAVAVTTPANRIPIANAGPDQLINCAPRDGWLVSLQGGSSSDPDNDPLTYTWKENGTTIATGISPSVKLSGGIHTITLTVNDGDGGSASDVVVVTVNVDTAPPVPTLAQLPDALGECSVTLLPPTASDNCAGTITATTSQPLTYSVQGAYTVTWLYTDANGNSAQQNQTVIVRDMTPPVLTIPSTFTTYRNSLDGFTGSIGTATATDNCTLTPEISNNAPNLFPLGTTKVLWQAVDAVGNKTTAEQLVVVLNRAPIAQAGPDQEFGCLSVSGTDVFLNGSASSDADGDPLAFTWKENGMLLAEGTNPTIHLTEGVHTIVLTVNDGKNGESSDEVLVAVNIDKTAPVLTVPQDVIVETTVSGGYVGTIGSATALDACEGPTSVTNDAPPVFPVGVTTVTWTSKDSKGNMSQAIQKVTVTTRPPIANAGIDQKFECAPKNGVTIHLNASTSSDPDNDPLTFTWMEGTATVATGVNPEVRVSGGTHVLRLVVADGLGGSASDEVLVTVNVDTSAPKITPPAAVIKVANIAGGYSGDIGTATASDVCDAYLAISNNAPQIFPLGKTTVLWKATDANGNASTAEQVVTVNPIEISLDVKPGSVENPVNLKAKGELPVAILSGQGFDAASVDKLSLKLGPGKAPALKASLEDVNSDGALDLMLHFDNQAVGATQTDTKIELVGKTLAGVDLKGCDKISIVGKLKKDGSGAFYEDIPMDFSLYQNYPNPFNPTTVITYDLPKVTADLMNPSEVTKVSLLVYDLLGREVAILVNEEKSPGRYSVTWNAGILPSGVYVYRLHAGSFSATMKLILIK